MWPFLPSNIRLREFTREGELKEPVNLVREMGFKEGQFVQQKGSKIVAKILEMKGDQIVLNVQDGLITGKAKVGVSAFLKKEWRIGQAPQETEEVPNFLQHTAQQSLELSILLAKADVVRKLLEMESAHQTVYESLKLIRKPQKSVVATANISKGALKLVPTTTRIEIKQPDEEASHGALCLGMVSKVPQLEQKSFWLSPVFTAPGPEGKCGFVSPFWLVKATHEKQDSNCEISLRFKPDAPNFDLKVPVIRNTKAIEAGQVLQCYVPKADTHVQLEELVPLEEPAMKRRRQKSAA